MCVSFASRSWTHTVTLGFIHTVFAADVYLCNLSVKLYLIAILWHLMVFPVLVLMYVLCRGYQTLQSLGSTWNRLGFPDFISAFLTISHMLRFQGCFQYLGFSRQ